MREKIGKALRARAEAIWRALEEYNRCAKLMEPPRDEISWAKILDTVFLAELDILKDTRVDVRALKWADASHREAALLYFNMKRAREEIKRLNVEMCRVLTAMYDEHTDYLCAISATVLTDTPLAFELRKRWEASTKQNAIIAARLRATALLPGFSGKLQTGTRIGRKDTVPSHFPIPQWASVVAGSMDTVHDDVDSNELEWESDDEGADSQETVVALTEFVENLDICN